MAHAIGAGRALVWMLLAAGGLIAVCCDVLVLSEAAAQNAKGDQEAAKSEPARPTPGQEVSRNM